MWRRDKESRIADKIKKLEAGNGRGYREGFSPTCELRAVCATKDGVRTSNWIEQKWVRGELEEWRVLPKVWQHS